MKKEELFLMTSQFVDFVPIFPPFTAFKNLKYLSNKHVDFVPILPPLKNPLTYLY